MHFEIRRDFSAIRFIRVSSLLKGFDIHAGGAGFNIPDAMARCRSEHIERTFQLTVLKPQGISPKGIAAHPSLACAAQNARYEAIESYLADELGATKTLAGVPLVHRKRFKWWLQRLDCGWASTIVAEINGAHFVTCSAKPTLLASLLKTWEEYRNPVFHGLTAAELENYTKPIMRLGVYGAQHLTFKVNHRVMATPSQESLAQHHVPSNGHHIVYLT